MCFGRNFFFFFFLSFISVSEDWYCLFVLTQMGGSNLLFFLYLLYVQVIVQVFCYSRSVTCCPSSLVTRESLLFVCSTRDPHGMSDRPKVRSRIPSSCVCFGSSEGLNSSISTRSPLQLGRSPTSSSHGLFSLSSTCLSLKTSKGLKGNSELWTLIPFLVDFVHPVREPECFPTLVQHKGGQFYPFGVLCVPYSTSCVFS